MHTIPRVNDTSSSPEAVAPAAPAPASLPSPARRGAGAFILPVIFALALVAAFVIALSTRERVRTVEHELARRQQATQDQAAEAALLGKQAQDSARESAAKVALLEARLAEVSLQRGQLEDLIKSLSRSRDENIVVDIDAGLRVAQQQSTITGSAEPLVAALKQADERLSRYSQPSLAGVRRAITRDLERVKAVGVADVATLAVRLDEAVRLVDELPLLAQAAPHRQLARQTRPPAAATPEADPSWWQRVTARWHDALDLVWGEVRSLVRVTRIDHPEAALLTPDQAFFLRENLKLRLLNARLALLSRQFETTQGDLQAAQIMLDRYFDRSSRRTAAALELVRQVSASARHVTLPRPDDTLAALAAAGAGR